MLTALFLCLAKMIVNQVDGYILKIKPLLGVHKTPILSDGVQELVPQCGVWYMKYFKVKEFEK